MSDGLQQSLDRYARLRALLDPSPDNPHALSVFGPPARRADLRALPLMFILVPNARAPQLAFPDEDAEGLASVLYADLRICWERWRYTDSPEKRKTIAIQARRYWARLVELAFGIEVTGARHRSVVCFVD